jgi:CIC family chloride channel protein
MEEQREEDILRVEDAMQQPTDSLVDAEETLEEALRRVDSSTSETMLVRMSPSGWSIVSRRQLRTLLSEGRGTTKLASLLAPNLIPYLHPDHPLDTALRYVDRWPLVPVVNRADFRRLEGIITQQDVLKRYREFGEG